MIDFENKPIQDWTLAECKEYCERHYCGNYFCTGETCILNDSDNCIGEFKDLNFNNIPKFTPDEIAFCRLIKKTYPWANYVARNKFNDLKFIELFPRFDKEGRNEIGTTGCFITIQSDFFPQIKPLTYYSIDDIIKQGGNNERN